MIPNFKDSIKTKSPTKESIEPFNQKYFRIYFFLPQWLTHLRVDFFQQYIKCLTINWQIIWLKCKKSFIKWVTENDVWEYAEGFHFSHYYCEHYGWICHSLHIAYIWPIYVKKLQNFSHFFCEFIFILKLFWFSWKRSLYIFWNLNFCSLIYPPSFSSFFKLDI